VPTSSCKASSRPTILHRIMGRPNQNVWPPANGCNWSIKALFALQAAIAFVITLVASAPAYSQSGASRPRLILEKARHDFGETFAGEDLSHAFWVRNVGATALELSERPS
jgi:hypothetical protein